MAFEAPGAGTLDYAPCRYGTSKLVFRGPARPLAGEFCLALGGAETYGKFVARPWPALAEDRLGLPVVNMGCMNAGADVFLHDGAVRSAAAAARVTVVQVTGAHNLSNRFYSVHPRRNDRFVAATPALRALFPEVDFTEFAFTRHLAAALAARSRRRFAVLAETLRACWVERTRTLMGLAGGEAVLLWVAGHPPEAEGAGTDPACDPLLVTRAMIEAVRPAAARVVEVVASPAALAQGTAGMQFPALDAPAAAGLPNPAVHAEVAAALAPALAGLL
ncbi:MAG: hypothetical protein KJZ85_06340 [Rhodobacteraceae bacterium]|nr:hypothetical protein [Paracoccaceae bacterium]